MDAGLAGLLGGVIGAAVGAIGAVGSAVVTGRKTEMQVRIQVEAQLRQARMQIKAEDARQQLEPRRVAYTEFLTQARRISESKVEILLSLHLAYTERHSRTEEETMQSINGTLAELTEKLNLLTHLWSKVSIIGPASTSIPASALYRASTSTVSEILTYGSTVADAITNDTSFPDPENPFQRIGIAEQELFEAAQHFTTSVRPILDIDIR
ncbi:hypothetical protein [Streptomyces sp. NPDC088674]|uniref:hypothetical protein n=1 Tax=Streptomyces sp. NPDC088674 TaxID=3365869 RepID=UPI0038245D10